MPNRAERPDAKKRTLKRFHVDTDKPVSIRFTNPSPDLTRIRMGNRDINKGVIELPPLRAGDAMHKFDFHVEFRKGDDEAFLHHSRKLDIEIRAGDTIYRDSVLPDVGGRIIAYRFVNAEFGPKLIYCAKCDDYVQPDVDGRCKIHH